MTYSDFLAILPLLVLTSAVVVVMLAIAFYRSHSLTFSLTLLALLLAFAALFAAPPAAPRPVTPLLIVDGYALFFMGLLIAATFVVAVLSYGYLERARDPQPEEFYLLLLLGTLGSLVLVASSHFASFFLGLELLSISLYALIAYQRGWPERVEAGLKYLVLAGASSAFLLFGMALVYSQVGTLDFAGIARAAAGLPADLLLLAGLALLIVGIGFKLAVVPFHLWTPDVYQGAPAPVTALVATLSKGAVFALLLRFFTRLDVREYSSVFLVFVLIAVASMIAGNLLALLQDNVKRILAYSSIAHMGYLLVGFLAGGALAATAVAFYLVAYFITTLGAFGVVTLLSGRDREAEVLEDYRGLFWRRPWLAMVFTAMLLSLAGIPLTAGFIGKFFVVAAGVGSAQWLLVVTLVVASSIGLFYYLRLVAAMYFRPADEGTAPALGVALPAAGSVTLGALTLLLLGLGVFPAPLLQLIEATVARIG